MDVHVRPQEGHREDHHGDADGPQHRRFAVVLSPCVTMMARQAGDPLCAVCERPEASGQCCWTANLEAASFGLTGEGYRGRLLSARRRTPMTAVRQQVEMASHASREHRAPSTVWIPAALVFVLAAVSGWRDGGFWHAEALAVAAIAIVLLATALVIAPPDRVGAFVLVSLGLLAVWWLLRGVTAGPGTDFLPLGASVVAFAAAFAAVRPLGGRWREVAGLALACLGAAGALVGFIGLAWRWSPPALPARDSGASPRPSPTPTRLGSCWRSASWSPWGANAPRGSSASSSA